MKPGSVRRLTVVLLSLGWSLAMAPPSLSAAQSEKTSSGQIHWTFRDIEIQTLLGRLKRFGVELPVPASGRVTVRLSAGAPWSSILRPSAYRVEGELSSDALTIAGVELRKLSLHLVYADGALDLTSMRFTVPSKNGPDGTIAGTATMRVRPAGDLTAQLSINQLPLATLMESVPELASQLSGVASGKFQGQAAAERLRDLTAWQAQGELALADVHAFGLPALKMTTDFRLAQGRLTIARLAAQLERAAVTGSGSLVLTSPYAFTSRLRATVPDLAWLNKLDADVRLPMSIAGSVGLTANAEGALQPKSVRVRGTVDGRNLKAENLTIDRLLIPYDGTLDRVRLNSLRVDLYGGRISANFSLPTDAAGKIGAGVRVRNVDLGRLASDALKERQPWRGLASGVMQFQAPFSRLTEAQSWSGNGQLSLGRANVLGIDIARITTAVRLDQGRLAVSQLMVDSTLAQVTGTAQANLTAPFGFGTALRIANVDLGQLNRLQDPRLPVTVAGRAGISLKAQGTLQPVKFTAKGGAAARGLRAGDVAVDRLDFDYEVSDRMASLSRIVAGLNRGQVTGSAQLGLAAPYEATVKLAAVNVDLSIANRLPAQWRPPLQMSGAVSASANLSGQLDPRRIEGTGDFNARNLQAGGARLDSLGFAFSADENYLALSRLAVVAYRGRVDGSVKVPLADAAEGEVDLRWQQVNFGRALTDLRSVLAEKAPSLAAALDEQPVEGWTWGSVTAHAPPGKVLDPASWTGDLDISLAAIRLFGWTIPKGFVKGKLANATAELTRLVFDINAARLRGVAQLQLAAPYGFESKLTIDKIDLADFNKLPEVIKPPVKLAGAVSLAMEAQGTLEPLDLTGNGSVAADQIEADGARLDRLAVKFDVEKDRVELKTFHAELYEGQIDGTASITFRGDDKGKITFTWGNVDLGELATDVLRLPLPLHGKIGGKLNIEIPARKLSDLAAWSVNATFETSTLTAESVTLGKLAGRLAYDGRMLAYNLAGDLLRGTLAWSGRWQPRAEKPAANDGHLQIAGARLGALAPLFREQAALGTLTGQVNVNVHYQHDEKTGLPSGAGDLDIDDLRIDDVALLSGVHAVVRVAADRIEIANVEGALAGGSLNASATLYFDPRRRGSFRASIGDADLAQVLVPWGRIAARSRGVIDAQIQGFAGGGRPLQLNGVLAIRRGRFDGVELSSVRAPFNGSFDLSSGRGVIQMHGVTGQVARGRLTGDFDLTLASGLGLNGRGKFTGLDLRTLLQQSAAASRLASGKLSGTYTLAGRNIRTLVDLTGTLNADLIDTQALSLPILQRTLPFLTGGVSGSTSFDTGELRAHLSRGVIRIERFSLSSGSVQIFAQGNVSLSGRLSLSVLANTGQLNARARTVSLLASRIALFVAPPVGLLLEVTQFLSNQVINLEVSGTIRSPTVRIRPLQFLGQEAAQFFLLQALP
jgi:hypothetical protein